MQKEPQEPYATMVELIKKMVSVQPRSRNQGGHQPIQDWLVGLDWTLLIIQSSVYKLVSNPIH
jgi:hypothetical protein